MPSFLNRLLIALGLRKRGVELVTSVTSQVKAGVAQIEEGLTHIDADIDTQNATIAAATARKADLQTARDEGAAFAANVKKLFQQA